MHDDTDEFTTDPGYPGAFDDPTLLGFASLTVSGSADQPQQQPLPPPPLPLPALTLVEFPSANVRDGWCILQGGAPVVYRFVLRLSPPRPGAILCCSLVARVNKPDGREVERVIEEGLRGADGSAGFDAQGFCTVRLSFASAGRGAPWIVRFVAVAPEQQQFEIARVDLLVRTFSKKTKIDALLSGAAAAGTPVPPSTIQSTAFPPPKPQRKTLSAATLPLIPFAVPPAPPVSSWWTTDFEAEIVALFAGVVSPGAPLARPLSSSDMAYIRESCTSQSAFASVDGARSWVARTAAEVAKMPRLWNTTSPTLVAGFVSRDRATALLSRCAQGSFLLRLSSGEPGELVIAFVTANSEAGGRVEQCYLRAEGETLDERTAVDRILTNAWLRDVVDSVTGASTTKEHFRPRGRYCHLQQTTKKEQQQ